MKEFENQWNNYSCELEIDCKKGGCNVCKETAKEWWGKALNWFLSEYSMDGNKALKRFSNIAEELNERPTTKTNL